MISIVSPYYNRKPQFYETLKSISRSKFKDIEYILVDDGSQFEHRVEDLIPEFPFLKIIRLERENRWYVNPCIPFNIGLREAKGDIIVLQNPESLHIHDVLSYFYEHLTDRNYIIASAYGLDKSSTDRIPQYNSDDAIIEFFKYQPDRRYMGGNQCGWFTHLQHSPTYYHFCSAISRENMAKLNGFDERFARGVGYDDDEILARIRKLGIDLILTSNISVFHQYHAPANGMLSDYNKMLVELDIKLSNNYRANNEQSLWSGI